MFKDLNEFLLMILNWISDVTYALVCLQIKDRLVIGHIWLWTENYTNILQYKIAIYWPDSSSFESSLCFSLPCLLWQLWKRDAKFLEYFNCDMHGFVFCISFHRLPILHNLPGETCQITSQWCWSCLILILLLLINHLMTHINLL